MDDLILDPPVQAQIRPSKKFGCIDIVATRKDRKKPFVITIGLTQWEQIGNYMATLYTDDRKIGHYSGPKKAAKAKQVFKSRWHKFLARFSKPTDWKKAMRNTALKVSK